MESYKITHIFAARIFAISLLLQLSSLSVNAQAPLGEQIQQEQSKVQEDRQQLRDDENQLRQQQDQSNSYIQQNQNWIQQADQQAAGVQSKLNMLEAQVKSPATLRKMLTTPGNQMYVLETWLKNEDAQKAQAEQNIQRAQQSMQSASSRIGQDRIQIESDTASVDHDTSTFRQEMDSNADQVRQSQQAAFWRHPRRMFNNGGQSNYDSGQYNMGTGTWGNR